MEESIMKKSVTALTLVSLAIPVIGFAAMAGSNSVNSAAIVDGSIVAADIANGTITGAKIATGTVTGANLASGTITATQLAAGAVTDAKITGPISVGKLPVGNSSTTVAAGNHTHSGAVKYAQIVVVAKTGGDTSSPVSALNSITDASAAKPYLVKVMPGVYDLGAVSLKMKPYVYLEGSGDASVIKSNIQNTVPGTSTCVNGTIDMANNSSVKNIRIENYALGTGNSDYGTIIGVAFNGVTSTLESVSVLAGSNNALSSHTTAVCAAGAATNATLINVNLEGLSGAARSNAVVNNNNANMTIIDSRLSAKSVSDTYAIDCCNMFNDSVTGVDGTMNIINSQLITEGQYARIADGNACRKKLSITNSSLTAIGDGAEGVMTPGVMEIQNSTISVNNGSGPAFYFDSSLGNWLKIANSKICGVIQDTTNVKLINDYDCDYNLIPNL
jgi:hypothetical protein